MKKLFPLLLLAVVFIVAGCTQRNPYNEHYNRFTQWCEMQPEPAATLEVTDVAQGRAHIVARWNSHYDGKVRHAQIKSDGYVGNYTIVSTKPFDEIFELPEGPNSLTVEVTRTFDTPEKFQTFKGRATDWKCDRTTVESIRVESDRTAPEFRYAIEPKTLATFTLRGLATSDTRSVQVAGFASIIKPATDGTFAFQIAYRDLKSDVLKVILRDESANQSEFDVVVTPPPSYWVARNKDGKIVAMRPESPANHLLMGYGFGLVWAQENAPYQPPLSTPNWWFAVLAIGFIATTGTTTVTVWQIGRYVKGRTARRLAAIEHARSLAEEQAALLREAAAAEARRLAAIEAARIEQERQKLAFVAAETAFRSEEWAEVERILDRIPRSYPGALEIRKAARFNLAVETYCAEVTQLQEKGEYQAAWDKFQAMTEDVRSLAKVTTLGQKLEKTWAESLVEGWREHRKTFYQRLDLAQNASQVDIQKLYRRRAQRWHPDVARGKVAELRNDLKALPETPETVILEAASQIFALINEANETLSDEGKRNAYDEELALTTKVDAAFSAAVDEWEDLT